MIPGASNVACWPAGDWLVPCVPVDFGADGLVSDPRFLGDLGEALVTFDGSKEKSHSIECFTQFEHWGRFSSHYLQSDHVS